MPLSIEQITEGYKSMPDKDPAILVQLEEQVKKKQAALMKDHSYPDGEFEWANAPNKIKLYKQGCYARIESDQSTGLPSEATLCITMIKDFPEQFKKEVCDGWTLFDNDDNLVEPVSGKQNTWTLRHLCENYTLKHNDTTALKIQHWFSRCVSVWPGDDY